LIDISFKNSIPPRRGRVLISDPFKNEEYFERSVVFLCEHDSENSFGFILNKSVSVNISGINEQFSDKVITAFRGGPCEEDSLFYIHTLGDKIKGSQLLGNGIYLGSNYEELYKIMTPDLIEEGAIKLFIGYSGWEKEQLQNEIERNAWVVSEVDSVEEVMLPKEDLWSYFMNKLGDKYQMMTKFPIDPNSN